MSSDKTILTIHTKTLYPKRDELSLLSIDKNNIHSETSNEQKQQRCLT